MVGWKQVLMSFADSLSQLQKPARSNVMTSVTYWMWYSACQETHYLGTISMKMSTYHSEAAHIWPDMGKGMGVLKYIFKKQNQQQQTLNILH